MAIGRFKKGSEYYDIDTSGVYDSSKEQSQAAINQALSNDVADLKSAISAETGNLFKITDSYTNPYVFRELEISWDRDGVVTLNGTPTGGFRIPIGTALVHSDPWLRAGEYNFTLTTLSGSVSSSGGAAFSLRAGANSEIILYSQVKTSRKTFSENTACWLQVGAYTFTDFRFVINIKNVNDALQDYTPNLTGYDYLSRQIVKTVLQDFAFPYKIADVIRQAQGGCIKGNAYISVYRPSSGAFSKLTTDIYTGVSTAKVTQLNESTAGHANDLTYNPNTDSFYLATMLTTGDVLQLDSDFNIINTLHAVDASDNPITADGIVYDILRNRYIVSEVNAKALYFYDSDFNYVATVSSTEPDIALKQGLSMDGYYIYRACFNANYDVYIRTYTADGTFISEAEIPELSGLEIEGLSYYSPKSAFIGSFNVKNANMGYLYAICPNSQPQHSAGLTMMYLDIETRKKLNNPA